VYSERVYSQRDGECSGEVRSTMKILIGERGEKWVERYTGRRIYDEEARSSEMAFCALQPCPADCEEGRDWRLTLPAATATAYETETAAILKKKRRVLSRQRPERPRWLGAGAGASSSGEWGTSGGGEPKPGILVPWRALACRVGS
jgi:hypothetical protein